MAVILDNKWGATMLFVRLGFAIAALLSLATPCFASNEVVMIPIANALNLAEAQPKLGNTIRFYFGSQTAGRVAQNYGNFVANPKTNAFNKTTDRACEWAFLSALISLRDQAVSVGANAVINIVSFYDKREVSSDTAFECHKGFLIAGVALRGAIVRLVGR
jgi:uncharacterized protein YbjQ (UPF0145 family)